MSKAEKLRAAAVLTTDAERILARINRTLDHWASAGETSPDGSYEYAPGEPVYLDEDGRHV